MSAKKWMFNNGLSCKVIFLFLHMFKISSILTLSFISCHKKNSNTIFLCKFEKYSMELKKVSKSGSVYSDNCILTLKWFFFKII